MGPVEWMVSTVEGFLDGAAESSFVAIAGALARWLSPTLRWKLQGWQVARRWLG